MAKKFGSFGKNVLKSVGRTGLAVTRDLMPNLSRSVKENKDFAVEKYKEVKEKPKNTDVKSTFLYKTTKSLIDNALQDLKDGNFNNEERQKKAETESFANMFGLDLNMFDDDFIDGDETYSMEESDSSSFNLDNVNITADFSDETKHDIKSIARLGGANLKVLNLGMANLSAQLTILTNFHNENTTRFYETVEEKLNEISSNLDIVSSYYKDLFENNRRNTSPDESLMAKFFDMQGVNIKEWMDLKKEADGEGTMGVLKMLLDMGKAQYENLAANPLGYLSKSLMKAALPKRLKNTMTKFDNMFGMAPMLLQGFKNSKNPFLELLGDMFDLKKFKINNKRYNYEKGAISFDGVTRRAITHVIPGYLSRILTAVTGRDQDKGLHYDYEAGKFVSHKDLTKKIREEIEDSMEFAMTREGVTTLSKDALSKAKEKGLINNDEDAKSYSDKINKALRNMARKGKSFHSIKNLSEISNDKELAEILMDSYKDMTIDDKRKTVSNMGRAFVDYQTFLKENAHNDLYQQAFDYKTFGTTRKRSEDRIKVDDIGKKVRANAKDLFNKGAKEVEDKTGGNATVKKILNFFTSEEETKLDKKLNNMYDALLDPLNHETNFEVPEFVKKAGEKYKFVNKIIKKMDKKDIAKKTEEAKAKAAPKQENKEDGEGPEINQRNNADSRANAAFNGKASDIKASVKNNASNIVNKVRVDTEGGDKTENVVKVHVVGGTLDGVETVNQVVNVDDIDENDTPKAGSASEQRKRMKKRKTGSATPSTPNKEETTSTEQTQEQPQEEEGNSILETVDSIADIGDALTGGNLLDKVAGSKLGGKVSSLLGKSTIGKGIKNGALELLTNPKGLSAGAKVLAKGGLGKIAGLAKLGGLGAKAAGLASSAGGALSTAASAAGTALPGLAASAGTALGGLGTAAAGALGAAAPFLLPALAIGGLGFGAYKLFKKKQKVDEFGNPMYDENGNPIMESAFGRMTKKIGGGLKKVGGGLKKVGKGVLKASPLGLAGTAGVGLIGKLFGKKKEEKNEDEAILKSGGGGSFDVKGENDDPEKPKVEKKRFKPSEYLQKYFEMTPMGMLYKLLRKDKKDKEHANKTSPEEKMSKFMEPVGKYFKSGAFKKIFGSSGLFMGMRDGLLGKVGSAIGGVFKKFFGTIFDSASKNVSSAISNTGSASVGSGTSNSTSSNQAEVTLDSSYATGNITSASQLINKSLKINSGVTAEQIDAAIAKAVGTDSYMYGTGKDFIEAGQQSGLDPLYLVAHAIEETGWGKSQIVKDKNNWYGIGAFDSSPYASAYNFDNKRAGIVEGAKWIAKNYTNGSEKQDTLYKMVHSSSGHNYATNPSWANNIATLMLQVAGGSVNGGVVGKNGGSSGASASVSNNSTVNKALSVAKSIVDQGYPYVWGGESPAEGGFDCSGLIHYAYKQAGLDLGNVRTTYDMLDYGKPIALAGDNGLANALPGDLIFPHTGHVYLYAGNGKAYEAIGSGKGIHLTDSPTRRKTYAIRRIVNQGDAASNNGLNRMISGQESKNKTKTYQGQTVTISQYTNMRNTDKNNVMLQVKNVMDEINESGETTNELLEEMLSLVTKMKDLKENANSEMEDPFEMTSELNSIFAGY